MKSFKDYLNEAEGSDDHLTYGGGATFGSLKDGDKFKFKDSDDVGTKTKNGYTMNGKKYKTGSGTAVRVVTETKVPKNTNETADFDYGHKDASELHTVGDDTNSKSFSQQGRANQKQRTTNARFGDNPLDDDKDLLDEDKASMLDRLQTMLNKIGVTNDDIAAGVSLSQRGMHKVAARLGTSVKNVKMLMLSLQTRVMDGGEEALAEDYEDGTHDRFTCERDTLNNITVRDARTGKQCYLQGTDAAKLIKQIDAAPSMEQDILKTYYPLMESKDDGFESEIKADSGSFNGTWDIDGQTGTMTVFYKNKNGKPLLKIESVRDADGNEIEDYAHMAKELIIQAKDFIAKV